MLEKPTYTPPRVVTLEACRLVESLGPVSAGSRHATCNPNGWMGSCPR